MSKRNVAIKFLLGLFFLLIFFFIPRVAFAYSDDPVIFQDDFSSLSAWQLTQTVPPNNIKIDTNFGHQSPSSLLLNYTNGSGFLKAERTLPNPRTNILARVFFYDNLQNLGTIFGLSGSTTLPNSTVVANTGLAVINSLFPNHYAMRFNTHAETKDTGITRTQGWHMFELIVTPNGTYAKIDNELVLQIKNGTSNPFVNSFQTDVKTITFTSTWNLIGQAYYDNLLLVSANTKGWKDQFVDPIEAFYNLYKDTSFSKLYPYLGDSRYAFTDPKGNPHSNDLRSLFATAEGFYLYGKSRQDQVAVSKAIQLFKDGINNGQWNYISDWARGVAMGNVVSATYLMRSDLDSTTLNKSIGIIYSQGQKYLDPNYVYGVPKSGYQGDTKAEENAWHAAFLAEVVNFFPNIPNRQALEDKAKCFAYHAITTSTDPAFCGIKTQTVYDDYHAENHNIVHPIYGIAAVYELALGASSYKLTGKPVPSEFKHNVVPLYNNFLKSRIDINTFFPTNNPPVDWGGARKSFYSFGSAFLFLQELGVNLGFDLDQLYSKRSLFFYHIASDYLETRPPEITAFLQTNTALPGYHWFLNSVEAAESPSILSLFSSTATSYLAGDINQDKKVDTLDYNILIQSFSKTGSSGSIPADIDSDGDVDIFDYNILVANFGKNQ